MSYVVDEFDGRVIELLESGGVGFMPSDTIYGLSCRALDQVAVQRLHKLKGRQANKPFIVLLPGLEMLNMLSIPKNEVTLAKAYWPGALTVVCAAPKSPDWLQLGSKTLAIRVPANTVLRKLINSTGPLVSTSANLQAQEPVQSVAEAQKVFGEQLDFYVDGGKLNGQPSTLAKIVDGRLEAIRQGAVKIRP